MSDLVRQYAQLVSDCSSPQGISICSECYYRATPLCKYCIHDSGDWSEENNEKWKKLWRGEPSQSSTPTARNE